jgi:hypothetical protein
MMTKTMILIGTVAAMIGAVPALAAREPLTTIPVLADTCTSAACAPRVPVTCVIDVRRAPARGCEHSARDVEELGRHQLDQLIATLN